MMRDILPLFNTSLFKYAQHIVVFAIITSLHVNIISGRGCVKHGKRGECCTNFYHHNGGCIPCPTGSYGDNCSTTCPYPSWGESCGFQCNCSADEVCSPHIGCVKTSTTSTSTTSTEAGNDMKSIQKSPKVETKSTRNPYSSKVDEVYPVPTDIIPTLAVVSKETYYVTPTSASGASTFSTKTKAGNYMKSTQNSIKPETDAAPNNTTCMSK
ncbi:uncharacterized protein LOC130046608 isoform X2 [Ostrea edulis]|uniref:uncharacterized protein LOC130046608 isoform X2 n=1 Tax=Ostrea edulis TaxID=37623 RepID=UPI0024AF0D65|nr:uncharacterized protein LOC130046608 isoform X2 [Ostrea edulis]